MPLRSRPPLTAREMAAYLAGYRLYRLWLNHQEESPTRDWAVARLAGDDAVVLCSLGARRFFRWFDRGWDAGELEAVGK